MNQVVDTTEEFKKLFNEWLENKIKEIKLKIKLKIMRLIK